MEILTFTSLQLTGKYELFFSVYQQRARRFISEEFLIRVPLIEKLPHTTIFKELCGDDFKNENTFIVCRLYRRGELVEEKSKKKRGSSGNQPQIVITPAPAPPAAQTPSMYEFKRPVGVGVFKIEKCEDLLVRPLTAEMLIKSTETIEQDFPNLHVDLVNNSVKNSPFEVFKLRFSLSLVKGKGRSNSINNEALLAAQSTNTCTSTLIMRPPVFQEDRNDIFLTIEHADIETKAKDKVEVMLQVYLDDEKSPNVSCKSFFFYVL